MDPKLREQLFIRKHSAGIITVIVLLLLLPLLVFFPQGGTQYRQQAAEIGKKPVISSPLLTAPPNINQSAGETLDYATFTKCFDKPGQTNPCTPAQHKAADLNNDGVVDGTDYNLYMRQKAGRSTTQ